MSQALEANKSPSLEQQFWRLFGVKFLLALLMTIPTVLFFLYLRDSAEPAKALIIQAWQAKLFHISGLSVKTSRIVMDVLLFTGIGLWGFLYFKGASLFSKLTPDPATQQRWFNIVLIATAVLSLVLIAVIPFQSRDIYGYINRGAQQAFYGINPYLVTVGEIPNWQVDPLFMNHWLDNPCPYGFFFAWLIKALVGLSNNQPNHQFLNAFFIIKSFNVLVYLITVWLVYDVARRFKVANPAILSYLYGLNPLMLLQLVANGHNDGLTALLALRAIWALTEKRWDWAALPLLTLSILTKYATLLLLPFIVLYGLYQRNWRMLLIGGGISIALAVYLSGIYLPSGDELWPAERMSANAGISQHSLHSALSRLAYYVSGMNESVLEMARTSLKPLFWALFALGYAGIWLKSFKTYFIDGKQWGLTETLETGIWWMVIMLFLASSKFNAWYVAMVFPLALLSGLKSRLCQLLILLSLFHLASFTPLENLHVLNFVLLTGVPFYLVFSGFQLSFRR